MRHSLSTRQHSLPFTLFAFAFGWTGVSETRKDAAGLIVGVREKTKVKKLISNKAAWRGSDFLGGDCGGEQGQTVKSFWTGTTYESTDWAEDRDGSKVISVSFTRIVVGEEMGTVKATVGDVRLPTNAPGTPDSPGRPGFAEAKSKY